MSEAIAERAAAIRQHLRDHPDRGLVRKYSFLAARWEELRLVQHDGNTTPDDDNRFREVSQMLGALTKKLGLGEDVTGWNGFLPKDPQRIISDSWLDCARMWFS